MAESWKETSDAIKLPVKPAEGDAEEEEADEEERAGPFRSAVERDKA